MITVIVQFCLRLHSIAYRGSALVSINVATSGPVNTGMGDRLRLDEPSRYATSHVQSRYIGLTECYKY